MSSGIKVGRMTKCTVLLIFLALIVAPIAGAVAAESGGSGRELGRSRSAGDTRDRANDDNGTDDDDDHPGNGSDDDDDHPGNGSDDDDDHPGNGSDDDDDHPGNGSDDDGDHPGNETNNDHGPPHDGNGSEDGNGTPPGMDMGKHEGWNNGTPPGWDKGKHEGWDEGEKKGWMHQYRNEIDEGVENGSVVMEASFSRNKGNIVQKNDHYRYGMDMSMDKPEANRVRVKISADFEEGKVVVLNIEKEVLSFKDLSDLRVYFDGEEIEMGSSEDILEANGTEAKYVVAMDDDGAQFLVYIPHFSVHVIEIESLSELAEEQLFTGANYLVMGLGVLILLGVGAHIFAIGKGRG